MRRGLPPAPPGRRPRAPGALLSHDGWSYRRRQQPEQAPRPEGAHCGPGQPERLPGLGRLGLPAELCRDGRGLRPVLHQAPPGQRPRRQLALRPDVPGLELPAEGRAAAGAVQRQQGPRDPGDDRRGHGPARRRHAGGHDPGEAPGGGEGGVAQEPAGPHAAGRGAGLLRRRAGRSGGLSAGGGAGPGGARRGGQAADAAGPLHALRGARGGPGRRRAQEGEGGRRGGGLRSLGRRRRGGRGGRRRVSRARSRSGGRSTARVW
mmetsp:Transcript_37671/g.99641  ORF Transcript_37671/g.99641 Transcript_37671/m.99641 type:complete len:263 (-) Transcript_37671:21-809(-)